jgi:alpha-tubulin suppressor-like RCC1 family protein
LLDKFNGLQIEDVGVGPAGYHTMIITKDPSRIYSWGHNRVGQVGHELYYDKNTKYYIPNPVQIERFNDISIKKISCGWGHNLILTDNGQIFSYGKNNHGQLGCEMTHCSINYENSYYRTDPYRIKEFIGKEIKNIYAGGRFSIVIDNENKLYTWGSNSNKQLNIDINKKISCIPVHVYTVPKIHELFHGWHTIIILSN